MIERNLFDSQNFSEYTSVFGSMRAIILAILTYSSFFSFSQDMEPLSSNEPKLIYVADPMCSWCYGFAPEYNKVRAFFKDEVTHELIMGGLRPYNTATIDDNLKSFLTEHWMDIGKRTSQPFAFDILEDSTFVYDTEPPARAVRVVRDLNPEAEWTFFKKVQTAFYAANRNTNDPNLYLELLEGSGVDPQAFLKEFSSETYKTLTYKDFVRAQQLGVRGFPSVLLVNGDQMEVVTHGYASADKLIKKITKLLENTALKE